MDQPTKEYTCQYCKRRRARWLCLVTQASGQRHPQLLCAFCSFITVPQKSSTTKFELLHDLLPSSSNEAPECESPLRPTGQASILRSLGEVAEPIGLFIEMRCGRCGFMIDLPAAEVNSAQRRYLHPNRSYNANQKPPKA